MNETTHTDLLPAERIALVAGLGRAQRGEEQLPNTATLCVLALARITGLHDYTQTASALCRVCKHETTLNYDELCPSCVEDSRCSCGGTKKWCSMCQVWSASCHVEYGTCQCS